MDLLNKTLLTNDENDLKKIYEEEVQKLRENDFKLSVLKRLNIEDFPNDLPEKSKKNIDRALIAVKIRDHINLGNGQKLLGELTSSYLTMIRIVILICNFRIRQLWNQ